MPDVKVRFECEVRPSEDPGKVLKAIENVSGGIPRIEGGRAVVEGKGLPALRMVYRKIRDRAVVSSVRRLLLEHMKGEVTWIYLNRQAAYMGKVVVCEDESESPLGPILLTLESPRLRELIDWLAPEL